ncbi:MAG: hypothetical protein AAF614_12965 [Chloroflexota bacterium]
MASEIDIHIDSSALKHEQRRHGFYVVSTRKFALLYLLTFGVYFVYWFYKNWAYYKHKHSYTIHPIARTMFPVFFIHRLFNAIDEQLKIEEMPFRWYPDLSATIFVILAIGKYLMDDLIGITYVVSLLPFVFLIIQYFILLRVQEAINFSQHDPLGESNSQLTGTNYFWMIVGVLFWLGPMLLIVIEILGLIIFQA